MPTAPTEDEEAELHPMPTSPTEDEEAELQAARHRYHASMLVRDHLETHTASNPGASSDYVTWIATLHPENADVTIDQRFFVPGNPWWTIYEDTKNDQIPTATAVPLPGNGNEDDIEQASDGPGREDNGAAVDSQTNGPTVNSNGGNERQNTHCCKTCSPVSLGFAVLVGVPALVGVLTCEMMALCLCHFPAKLFYRVSEALAPPNVCTCLLYCIFRVLYCVFSVCDSILLMVSVIVTEIVALAAFLVGFCTGGALWARYLHQQIRRMCHGIRILFRKTSGTQTRPPRHFGGLGNPGTDEPVDNTDRETNDRGVGDGDVNVGDDSEKNQTEEPVVSATPVDCDQQGYHDLLSMGK